MPVYDACMMHELLLLLIGGQDADSSVGLDRSIKARAWAWHFGTPTTSKRTRVMFWPKRRTGKGSPMMTINWRGVIEMSRFSLDCCILQGCRFSVKGRNHPRPSRIAGRHDDEESTTSFILRPRHHNPAELLHHSIIQHHGTSTID
jgi:hypothetical protein